MVSLVTVVGCIFVAGRSRHHIAICDGTLHPSHQKQRKMRPFVRTHARKKEPKKKQEKTNCIALCQIRTGINDSSHPSKSK